MKDPKHLQRDPAEAVSAEYLCGVRVGERVRLLQELVMRDERGRPTSEVHEPGEIWTVLSPTPDMPWRVWLREPNGDSHAWADSDKKFWSWFERVDENES
jgi:hypothetical protein